MWSIVGLVHLLLALLLSAVPTKKLLGVEVEGGTLRLLAPDDCTIVAGKYGQRRLYFDLTPMIAVKEALTELRVRGVARARVTQLDADTVRIVLDFTKGIPKYEITDRAIRLRLKTQDSRLKTPKEKTEAYARPPLFESKISLSKIVDDLRADFPDILGEPQNDPPLKRSTKDASKPRAKSLLAIKKVVIDAGHGGKDTGAIGKKAREKDVNLAIALEVGKELEKLGVKVVYTRKNDRFLSLQKRASIANQSGADLFISIHANSNRSQRIHGIETYYLDTSSSRYASRLARRENGQGEELSLDPEEESESIELPDGSLGADLRLILADLAMRSATSESKRLAGYVQSSLIGSLRKDHREVKDLGVKHALFAVLLGVRMPSVLIETGFVTHPTEGARLTTSAYQKKVAKAIARGVERLIDDRQQLAVIR